MDPRGQAICTMFIILGAMVPIGMRIWTRHQERMAEIYARSHEPRGDSEVTRLRSEVGELKEMLHQQIIAMDSMHRDGTIKERLEQKN